MNDTKTLFRYFFQLAGTGKGAYHRAFEDSAIEHFLTKTVENGEKKYEESVFVDWWDSLPDTEKSDMMFEAPEGMFYGLDCEEGRILCSLETGEPVSDEDLKGQPQPEGSIVEMDAPTPEELAGMTPVDPITGMPIAENGSVGVAEVADVT